MPARTSSIAEALHERAMLKRAVTPRLDALRAAFRQLEHLAQYNPDSRDRDYILSCARQMYTSLSEKYNNVAVTQLDMELFDGEREK
jgi:hypothetical protein